MLICRNRATFSPTVCVLRKSPNGDAFRSTSFSNAISVPGRRHAATLGSSTAAKPRVMELLNWVVTSLSPTFAGRDATLCRLKSHIGDTPLLRTTTMVVLLPESHQNPVAFLWRYSSRRFKPLVRNPINEGMTFEQFGPNGRKIGALVHRVSA